MFASFRYGRDRRVGRPRDARSLCPAAVVESLEGRILMATRVAGDGFYVPPVHKFSITGIDGFNDPLPTVIDLQPTSPSVTLTGQIVPPNPPGPPPPPDHSRTFVLAIRGTNPPPA